MTDFTDAQVHRYARHIILDQVGGEGQAKLLDAKVLLVGAGGLGSPVALYLAAAGIGTIGLVDDDRVDLTNLQRQVLHATADVGRPKVDSGAEALHAINPDVDVVRIADRLSSANALELFGRYDVIVDGSDNFPTRYLANDAAYLTRTPLVHGAIFQFEGQASTFDTAREGAPCYRCVFAQPPPPGSVPNCAQAGIFGAVAGVIGTVMAAETIKLVLGLGDPLIGRLLLYDALESRFTEVRLARDPACPLCGSSPEITGLVDYEEFCGMRAS